MKLLKFAFWILGILLIVAGVYSFAYGWSLSVDTAERFSEGLSWSQVFIFTGDAFHDFTMALFCILGAKITAMLEGETAAENIRDAARALRRAGDKTDD